MRRVLMIVDKPFLLDIRVRKEAFALAEEGYGVVVLTLEPGARPSRRVVRGVTVYTFPFFNVFRKSTRSRSFLGILLYRALSAIGYVVEYFYFIALCLLLFPLIALRDGFDAIHVNNPPAVVCLASSLYKVLGKKIVFDHHDLEPELFLSRYRVSRSPVYWILLAIEAASIRLADLVIATNESYRAIEMRRGGIGPQKIFIVRNAPDAVAPPVRGAREAPGRPLSLVYVGTMGPQDGVDYLLRALDHLRRMGRTDFRAVIIGEGDALPDLTQLCRELALEDLVTFTGFIPRPDLERRLAAADICLDPNPSSPLNDHSTWIKVMEYMSYAKPIVSFDLRETRFTAQNAAEYVPPNDERAYAAAVAALMDDPDRRRRMGLAGYARVTTALTWAKSRENLLSAYAWLFGRRDAALLRRLYYRLKPIIPRVAQIGMRSARARRTRLRAAGVWPIDRRSARAPIGWSGWPDGRRFALVLTHDVENVRGVERCRRVAELERRLGLRSSFNFVPERYATLPGLRGDLAEAGFEIGVHDLTHDGRLYESRGTFARRAARINGYLRCWGAVGFRSASMQHNLEWIRDLGIEYDCSTFDTDPFEPQPDGIGSIFPLWVPPVDGRRGYVEMPYTLVQDLTLFVLLGEKDTRIWKEKLEWIAQNGGMALVNTHPDYMWWREGRRRVDEYPFDLYDEFLGFVSSRYAGQFWHALPRDVARYCRSRLAGGQEAADDAGRAAG